MADEGEKFSTCISLHSEVNIKENPQKGWCIFFDRRMQITQVYLHKKKHSACKISTEIQQIHHRVNDRPQWQMVCICLFSSVIQPVSVFGRLTQWRNIIKVSSWNTLKHRKGACLSAAHHSTKIPPMIIHWCFQIQYVYQFKHPGGIPGAHPGLFSSGPSAPSWILISPPRCA